jgi:hypothetical protein
LGRFFSIFLLVEVNVYQMLFRSSKLVGMEFFSCRNKDDTIMEQINIIPKAGAED